MSRTVLWACVLVAAAGAACRRPTPAPRQPPLGEYPPVKQGDLPRAKFIHYYTEDGGHSSADFAWTFSETGFLIEGGEKGIPRELVERLLGEGAAASRIEGDWALGSAEVFLTRIRGGAGAGRPSVRMRIFRTAPTMICVGKRQYTFTLAGGR